MDLAEYDFQIMHCTGPSNVVVDALSRPLLPLLHLIAPTFTWVAFVSFV
jgi:hypothetical protein